MEDKRIADYFVIAGVPPQPRTFDLASSLPPVTEPITDLAVIIRSNSEPVPKGFICIEETPTGHKADLNHGSIRSPSVFLCIKRGRDRPPLVDVGVFYDDGKERVIPQCRVIRETPSGFPANVNNSGTKTFLTYRRLEPNAPANQLVVTDIVVILSNKGETPPHAFMLIEKNLNKGMFGSDVYLCYKKSMDRPPFIAFPPVIVDRFPLADHASFSLSEHLPNFCLPMGATVECWPATAARPSPAPSTFILTQNSGEKVYASLLNFYEPVSSPTELTRPELKALGYIEEDFPDEEEVVVVPVNPEKNLQQIKSICLLSHWPFFDQFKRFLLFLYKTFCSTTNFSSSSSIPPASTLESYIFHFMRDIPFPSPERPNILVNLCSVRGGGGGGGSLTNGSDHLPPIQETTLLFTQTFDDLPIPSNGASFRRMLFNLGPENCLHALLFALTEQKILLHSLRPSVLTEVAEAITTIIFPLNWHCPYIPMCPMSMSQYLHAPLPFIFGIDSRYFDYFLPPSDVASIDIDTKAIYLSESKRHLNMKMLPRKETKQLRAVLETIYERFRNGGPYDFSTFNTSNRTSDLNARRKLERQIETEIQEAFLVFMASILRDFRHYLKPITAAPSVGATDPGSLFDLAGFVASRHPATQPFYEALTRTQMFTKFIEERSLVSDKNVSLAFFDECVEKVERWERAQRSKVNSGSTGSAIAPLSLLTDGDDGVNGGGGGCGGGSSGEGNKTVFITIPEHSVPSTPTTTTGGTMNGQENGVVERSLVKQSSSKSTDKFGPFDHQRFYRLMKEHSSASRSPFQLAEGGGGGSLGGGDGVDQPDSVPLTNYSNSTTTSELATYMFARRAKHEIRKAQRTAALARRQSPVEWAKHLLLNAYSLWFTHFPAYSHLLMQELKMKRKKTTPVKPLSLAYQVLQRMQALSVRHPDEFCYRILMILCGIHSQPALAVKVFLDMQRHQVRLNAITYGYYNKAVLEGNWPGTTGTGGNDDEEESGGSPFGRALLKWAKLRNTVRVVFHLSRAHINKRSSKEEAEEEEEKRVKRNLLPLFSTAASNETATSEGQTSRERSTSGCSSSKSEQEEHKSELKSEEEEEEDADQPITTNGNAAAVHQRVVTAKEVNGVLTISVKDTAISPSSATTLNTTATTTTTTTTSSSSDTSSSSLSSTSSSSSSSSSSSAAKSSSTSSEEEEEATTANVQPDADNNDSSNSTFSSRIFGTPLKEALNSSMDFFSPKSRFGLGIRSSFRIAKSFAKPTKYNLPRSSTFGPSENGGGGGGSVKSTRPESTTSSTPPRPALPRSSTLPQSFSSSSDALNRGNGSTPLNDNSTRTIGTLPSAAATSTPSATAATDFSPFWTNKSYSALKNYANLFASSPVKLNMVSAMTTSSNYLISQIKNFAFDEDGDAGANSTMNDREEEEAMLNGFGGVDGAETEDNFELLDRYAELFTTLAEHYSTAVDSLRRRKKGRNEEEETEDSSPEIVFRLWMMSATVCRFCASVLYDEEIMCQWGPEDSNLNTRCIHCHAAFPPSLTIYPQDYRSDECQDRLEPISVPYLSPLVLRKELETILSGEGYGSLIRAHFLDSHPIVYWNLLWYFSRLNLPSHIPALVLTAASINSGALKGDSKAVYDHRNVSVVCLVDSEQLYSGGSTPMHWRWMKMKNEQSAANSTSNSTTTAEVPSSSSSPSDGEIIPQLVEYIRSRKVITPLQYLISERSTEKTKTTTAAAAAGTRRFNSIYRELLFMAQLELPEQISSATFDKDYHEAFESLTSKEKESLDALDRPPSIGAIFCRMLFKQLELLPITTTTTTT